MLVYISNVFSKNNIKQMGKITKYIHKYNKATYYCYGTKHYEELLYFRKYLYEERNKIIPRDLEFTPNILLHWYIGDGSLSRSGKTKKYSRICTQGFSIDDVEFAVTKFNKMGLDCTRQPSCNTIRFINNKTKDFLNYIGNCPKEIEHIYGYKFDY